MPITLSPLRYPGGKTQLYKFMQHTIKSNSIKNATYCEPFCGGAGIAISLLLHGNADSIILNDFDTSIWAVWYAILNETNNFITAIKDTPITLEEWYKQREIYKTETFNEPNKYSFELAFATFFLNRTNRAGIITGGPIGGYNQNPNYPLDCRFKKDKLIQKILAIANEKKRIRLYRLDASDLIHSVLLKENPQNLFIYFDPPYYHQGKNLYKNFFDDAAHVTLSKAIKEMNNYKWIATYDNHHRIKEIYSEYDIKDYKIQYSANRTRKETELLFYSPITKVSSYDTVIF